jgi:hypothetical protein
LRIIRSICDASVEQGGANLIRELGLYEAVERVADHDQAVMVRELALELVKACDGLEEARRQHHYGTGYENSSRSSSNTGVSVTRPGTRRSSSAAMPSSSSPITSSPQLLRTGKSFLMLAENGSGPSAGRAPRVSSAATSGPGVSTPSGGTVFRPISRDGPATTGGGPSVSGIHTSGSNTGSKSRLPRTSHGPTKLSRLSLASQRREQQMQQKTPTHTPIRGAPRVSDASLLKKERVPVATGNAMSSSRSRLVQARQRRLTSGASGSSDGSSVR